MNYLEVVNQFWRAHEENSFSPCEIAFYFFIANVCNKHFWRMPVSCSTEFICFSMGCSKQSICNARNTLKKRGLIDFKAGIRGKKAPTYSICHLTKELTNDMTDELTNDLTTKLTHIKNKKTTKNKHNINSKREEEKDNSDKQNDMLPSSYDSRKELLADTFWQSEILIKLVSEGFPLDSNSLKNALESFLVYTEKNVVDERETYNCKLHFYNWIKKTYSYFFNYGKENSQYDRRRGVKVCPATPEEYEEPYYVASNL